MNEINKSKNNNLKAPPEEKNNVLQCVISSKIFKKFLRACFLSADIVVKITPTEFRVQNHLHPTSSIIAGVILPKSSFIRYGVGLGVEVKKIIFNRAKTLRMLAHCQSKNLLISIEKNTITFRNYQGKHAIFKFSTELLAREEIFSEFPPAKSNYCVMTNTLISRILKACEIISKNAQIDVTSDGLLTFSAISEHARRIKYSRAIVESEIDDSTLDRQSLILLQIRPEIYKMLTLDKLYSVKLCLQYEQFIIFEIIMPEMTINYYIANMEA